MDILGTIDCVVIQVRGDIGLFEGGLGGNGKKGAHQRYILDIETQTYIICENQQIDSSLNHDPGDSSSEW